MSRRPTWTKLVDDRAGVDKAPFLFLGRQEPAQYTRATILQTVSDDLLLEGGDSKRRGQNRPNLSPIIAARKRDDSAKATTGMSTACRAVHIVGRQTGDYRPVRIPRARPASPCRAFSQSDRSEGNRRAVLLGFLRPRRGNRNTSSVSGCCVRPKFLRKSGTATLLKARPIPLSSSGPPHWPQGFSFDKTSLEEQAMQTGLAAFMLNGIPLVVNDLNAEFLSSK